jgi:hypothetical protein
MLTRTKFFVHSGTFYFNWYLLALVHECRVRSTYFLSSYPVSLKSIVANLVTLEYRLNRSKEPVHPETLTKFRGRQPIPVSGHGDPYFCETSSLPHFLDNWLTDGGEVFSLKRRPHFTPRMSWYSFLLRYRLLYGERLLGLHSTFKLECISCQLHVTIFSVFSHVYPWSAFSILSLRMSYGVATWQVCKSWTC